MLRYYFDLTHGSGFVCDGEGRELESLHVRSDADAEVAKVCLGDAVVIGA